jgi:two-component sensor histidine kinase
MNMGKRVGDFMEPIVECAELETLEQVLGIMTQGKPVAIRSAAWRLLLPETVIGYPLSRRVIDLPLRDVPVISPDLIAEEALTRLLGHGAPYGLVVDDQTLLGVVSLKRLQEYGQAAERERVEETFKVSLQQKEVLLREVHHRIKNNLQIISSLLDIQASYVQDPHMAEMFTDIQNRVLSMALLHETLYQSSDLGLVNFGVYIRSLAEQVFHSYNILADRIVLQIQADEVMLDTNQAVPCGLILNELLSNCLKHAFPSDRGGEVSIELRSDVSRRVTMIVRDTGIGFPTHMDFRQTETIGLQLVCTLTEQLGGTLELDRDAGTAFRLSFTP